VKLNYRLLDPILSQLKQVHTTVTYFMIFMRHRAPRPHRDTYVKHHTDGPPRNTFTDQHTNVTRVHVTEQQDFKFTERDTVCFITYACPTCRVFPLKCWSSFDDGRCRPKHVKVSFILKIVALDGTYSLFILHAVYFILILLSHLHLHLPSNLVR
jgi:hypothetical protein